MQRGERLRQAEGVNGSQVAVQRKRQTEGVNNLQAAEPVSADRTAEITYVVNINMRKFH